MNTAVQTAESAVSMLRKELKDLKITDRDKLRRALIIKHGSLTEAAANLGVPFSAVSDAIGGRKNLIYVVIAIQSDLGLSDNQVLHLWPLLRTWPRKSRVVS